MVANVLKISTVQYVSIKYPILYHELAHISCQTELNLYDIDTHQCEIYIYEIIELLTKAKNINTSIRVLIHYNDYCVVTCRNDTKHDTDLA